MSIMHNTPHTYALGLLFDEENAKKEVFFMRLLFREYIRSMTLRNPAPIILLPWYSIMPNTLPGRMAMKTESE